MTVSIAPIARQQFLDSSGNPAVGSKLFTYAAGSSAKQTTYTTSAGDTANTNPIVLDSEGKTPYGVWLTDGLAYKFVLAQSTDTDPPGSGVTLGDNILGSGAVVTSGSQWLVSNSTPTYISANSFSLVGDKTTDFHVGRRLKMTVASGTVYGFITSSVFSALTTITVQVDTITGLDSGLSAVEVGILTADNNSIPNVPRVFNAVNDIINGQFRIAQAGSSFAAPASGDYDLDGWFNGKAGAAVFTIASAAGSSTGKLCRTVTVTTADAAIAAGDYVLQQTRVEGYDAVKYLGNTFTIGFDVKSAVTGVHCLSIFDGTNSYVSTFTISASNTWETKTITITGGLTAANSTTNLYGFQISFANACGSTFQTTADSWQAGLFYGTSAQVNDVATINNVFAMQNVTLNLGETVAINDLDITSDTIKCLRYFEVGSGGINSVATAAGQKCAYRIPFKTYKRGVPTLNYSTTATTNVSVNDARSATADSLEWYTESTAAGQIIFNGVWTASSRL